MQHSMNFGQFGKDGAAMGERRWGGVVGGRGGCFFLIFLARDMVVRGGVIFIFFNFFRFSSFCWHDSYIPLLFSPY